MSIAKVIAALGLVALAGCQTAGSPQQNGSCRPEFSPFAFGNTSNWLMIVSPAGCTDQLTLAGSDVIGSSVVQQPANGTAFINSTFYGYTPNLGYLGPDKYTMSITGSTNGVQGTSTVIVNVQVKP